MLVRQQRAARAQIHRGNAQHRESCHIRPAKLGQRITPRALAHQFHQRLRERRRQPRARRRRLILHFNAEAFEHAACGNMLAIAQFRTGVRANHQRLRLSQRLVGGKTVVDVHATFVGDHIRAFAA